MAYELRICDWSSDVFSSDLRFLRARRHFWPLTHREMGMLDYNGPAYRFEKTPSCLSKAAPCLGEHTDEVLQDVLGFTVRRIDALRAAGEIGRASCRERVC